jgi:hypothetical protein
VIDDHNRSPFLRSDGRGRPGIRAEKSADVVGTPIQVAPVNVNLVVSPCGQIRSRVRADPPVNSTFRISAEQKISLDLEL